MKLVDKNLKLLTIFTMSVMFTFNFSLNTFAEKNVEVSEIVETAKDIIIEENSKLAFTILSQPTDGKNGTVEVKCIDKTIETIEVPSTIKYNNKFYDIISIGKSGFSSCENLTSIKLPDTLQCIGAYAFLQCSKLESIDLPDNITNIEDYTFFRCTSLKSIKFPKNLTQISFLAFIGCKLDSIELPDKLEYIGTSAFDNCTELISIQIPSSVRTIGGFAFSGCINLKEVTILSENINIDYTAFDPGFFGIKDIPRADGITLYVVNQTVKDDLINKGFKEENIKIK